MQTKHEITSIHLNDGLHWLYLAFYNNLPLLLLAPFLFLSIGPRSFTPLSSPFLILSPLRSFFLFHPFPNFFLLAPSYFISFSIKPHTNPPLFFHLVSGCSGQSVKHMGILYCRCGSGPIDWGLGDKLGTSDTREEMQIVDYKLYVTVMQQRLIVIA